MQANNRAIGSWLDDIRRGVVRLPRFQRGEAWKPAQVEAFLDAVIRRNSPIGVLLVLDVNPTKQPFQTRPLEGTANNGEACKQHLLDGQQRLTALWKSMNNMYEDRVYFVSFSKDDAGDYTLVSDSEKDGVKGYSRKSNSWIGNSREEYQKKLMPVSCLCPGTEAGRSAVDWAGSAGGNKDNMLILIMKIRGAIENRMLPFLCLPMETPPEEAINIFVNTNVSFVKLTPYDIAVAQFEAATNKSLAGLIEKIEAKAPGVVDLEGEDGVGDLALKIGCLFQSEPMKPTYGNYGRLKWVEMEANWDALVDGVKWTVKFLNQENIWDRKTLPSTVPLRVLPALHRYLPGKGDAVAKAERLVRQYVWRAFATDRYERQANDRLFKDYKAIKEALEDKSFKCTQEDTIFDKEIEMPDPDDLVSEGWPTGSGIQKRAILAACVRSGARDVASGRKIDSRESILNCHHHHIFPKQLLTEEAEKANPNLALNCMLLEGTTNQSWGDSPPGEYLMARVEESGFTGQEAEDEVSGRLRSHLIPEKSLMSATSGSALPLEKIYKKFIDDRANLVATRLRNLCKKGNP